jgi:hypothetical protein
MKNVNVNVNDYMVLSNGSVDVDATVNSFRTALVSHLAERGIQDSVIAEAIATVFAQNKSTSPITTPTLIGLTLTALNAQPENFKRLGDQVKKFIQDNNKGDSSLFVVSKGVNGGIRVRADIVSSAK